ncbi:MAG: DUF1670 domain-containing protein [Anaerolineae bacterium]|nr:DUF1670 domain-containing protein [Anaerolineae bacterium]
MTSRSSVADIGHRPAASKAFRFYLLGDVRVVVEDSPRPNPPHRVHSLLAALLLRPQPQRRDRLAGLLFPDVPEQTGRRRLSDLLWLLRRALPDLPLETNAQEVCLPPEARWLDVEAFRQFATQDDLDNWLEALALYRGDLLEGVYDEWLVEERETLYLQYVHLCHSACNELLRQQRLDQVLPLVERLVQAEPYDEAALRTLMKVYQGLGRRGAALAAYERFLVLAADELGAEPEAATQTLAQSLQGEDAALLHRPLPALPADASPEILLHRARQAVAGGDGAAVQALLAQLRARPVSGSVEEICLLEVDEALCFEEYERAASLLGRCQPHSAPVLVRRAQLAFHQRQAAKARDTASEALMLAHDCGDRWAELDALLILAHAQRRSGEGVQAARSAEQALKLARSLGSPAHVAQAFKAKGYTLYRQGRDAEALSFLHEMRSLAHEHGLRTCLAEALRGIATIHSDHFSLAGALSVYQEELSIWRDLGLRGREAQTLHNLAIVQAQLGRLPECLRTLEQARLICEQLCDPVELAINQYNVADTLLHYDDANAHEAAAVICQVLEILSDQQQPAWEAAASATLGSALWIQGQHAAALDAFRRAHDLYEQMGELPFLAEMLACQALACLGLEQPEQALALSRRAVLSLAQGAGFAESTPVIYYAHARALEANSRADQAREYLARAYHHLLAGAAQLEDEPARQACFAYHPITRRLMQQVYACGLAPTPAAGVFTHQLRASRPGNLVPVRLTLDAGLADAALKQTQGAVALRRARLARLLQEAQAQGARPTLAQLADLLDVSQRTLKRDLAVLRQRQ